jgi:hypothetical protein
MKAVSMFSPKTIDGITYFEPEDKMTYDEALEWAKTRGLRLLTRGEWCDLFDYKKEFRKSCQNVHYWTASVAFSDSPFSQESAWVFSSYNGSIHVIHRHGLSAVRAILAEPEGHRGY